MRTLARSTLRLVGAALLVTFVLGAIMFAGFEDAASSELQTSHRAGDVVTVPFVCNTEAAVETIARGAAGEDIQPLEGDHKCQMAPPGHILQARLVRWLSGPYRWEVGPVSVWETTAPENLGRRSVGYTLLPDQSGMHDQAPFI